MDERAVDGAEQGKPESRANNGAIPNRQKKRKKKERKKKEKKKKEEKKKEEGKEKEKEKGKGKGGVYVICDSDSR